MDEAPKETTPSRPKLNLKPRDPDAAAKLDAERQQALAKASPFGAAKPREVIIATRVGKSETEILLEEVKKEKLHLRLDGAQLEEKRGIEAELKQLQEKMEEEADESNKEALQKEVDACQTKLDDLIEKFAKATLETALSGEAPRMSQIRPRQPAHPQLGGGHPAGRYNPTDQYGGPPRGSGFRGTYIERGQSGGYGRKGPPLPEWAKDSAPGYAPPAGGGRGFAAGYQQPGGGFDRQGSGGYYNKYQAPPTDGFDEISDAGFFDQPGFGGSAAGGSYGGQGQGRGRGRGGRGGGASGRGGGGGGHPRNSGGASGGGGGYYGGGGNSGYPRGAGGEIDYDGTFVDRY